MDQDIFITIREASRMLAVHPNTLRNWDKEGKLKAMRIGARRDRRYLLSTISKFIIKEEENYERSN